MKIGIIVPTIYKLKYPYDSYGGIEPIAGNLAVEFAKMGHEVTVFAPMGSKLTDNVKIVETVEANINYHYTHEQAACNIAMEYIKDNPQDIIHDHTHQKYIYMHKVNHPEMKVCSTLHNQVNFQNPPPSVSKMNLIGISDSHCGEASGVLGIHVERVYNGIDVNSFIYNEVKSDYFLFLSRIGRMKGAHEAIQAAKESGNKLLVAGEDIFVNDPAYVLSIMNSCDRENIKYLGNVSEDKKRELLSNARALVLPILWNEPFGIIAIEALASGTPVITAPRGAMTEIVQHKKSGLFCYNVGEIKSAMKLVSDMIKSEDCRKRAEEFSIDVMTKNYLELYKRIISGDEW
jgi:glycosyltransferase involved in cell wall biosynthesis